jgi:hypothetical protein
VELDEEFVDVGKFKIKQAEQDEFGIIAVSKHKSALDGKLSELE